MDNIIYFNHKNSNIDPEIRDRIGIRGRRVVDFGIIGLPVAPGFIFDSQLTAKLPEMETEKIKEMFTPYIQMLEKEMQKKLGDQDCPLLLKVVLSSNLSVPSFPSVHHVGLNFDTLKGFSAITGKNFAYAEFLWMLRGAAKQIYRLTDDKIAALEKGISRKTSVSDYNRIINGYLDAFGDRFSSDAYDQLALILKHAAAQYRDSSIDVDESLSVMIQAMVYGNAGENSFSGNFYTRNIIDGTKKINGIFVHNGFDENSGSVQPIENIDEQYYNIFTETADKVEKYFHEIRKIKFTIEENSLWIIEQREVDEKSTQANLKTLLDLCRDGVISEQELICSIKPAQLNELLHPVINPSSARGLKQIKGGIAGSTGAAIGRVCFSSKKLLEEHRNAVLKGEPSDFILVLPSSFAEDVKAIEVAKGVITTEGGFSSHAPVVARSLGKVAMVQPDMKLSKNSLTIGDRTIKEGEYISMDVPYYESPSVYSGKVSLIEPDFEKNGLLDFMAAAEKYIGKFNVRANADQGRDAKLAKIFFADGIGLCRTEHMFFNEKRIMKFREMIISVTEKERRKVLEQLKPMQRSDFYDMFKIMEGKTVTIRLLDAPLHEFLPRNEKSMEEFIKYMTVKNKTLKPADIRRRCEDLAELNPMLGHRGCRVAVTYPEIYEMQIRAVFEAVCMLKKEGITALPEIMIPVVMSAEELRFIKNGKQIEGRCVKGIRDIYSEVIQEYGVDDIDYRVGTMIELPAAALGAGNIARYADFFSFGTNDLTQTAYGLSRDDSGSFFPDYSLFDLMKANPFNVLGEEVKELIETAAERGRLTRPDLVMGLCGEHGTNPENIKFLIEAGLNYVSTSAYSIPLAKLSIARYNIEKAGR